jgi:hypothetical protein
MSDLEKVSLTVNEALERISSEGNILNTLKTDQSIDILHKRIKNGTRMNGHGVSEDFPPFLRQLAAVSGKLNGIRNTADTFNMHYNTVKYFSHGKVGGHQGREDESLLKSVESAKEKVVNTAVDKLLAAVGGIDSEEINALEVQKKVKVSVGLASIVDKLGNKEDRGPSGPTINIYAPNLQDEGDYTVIDVTPGVR